ncbi:MAG TPA: hypothetical protein V6C97_14450 [Oculatellaceae cyanobacterium]
MIGFQSSPQTNNRRNAHGGSLAEFGPALWIFFLFFLFPLFNLVQFACGVATVMLIANQSAQAASAAPDFQTGLTNARNIAQGMASSGFGKFAHLTAIGQYGVSLYIDVTNVSTKQQTSFGPDTPLTTTVDPNSNIYEVEARCSYDVGPMLPMQQVPYLNSIPLIGKPAQLSFSSQRTAEFPGGLSTVGGAP